MGTPSSHTPAEAPQGFWAQVHHSLFNTDNGKGHARLIENSVGWLIIASVAAIVAEHNALLYQHPEAAFRLFDVLSVGIFTIEYLMRLGASAHDPAYQGRRFARLRYMLSPYALVDLAAIAPFYFAAFIPMAREFAQALLG